MLLVTVFTYNGIVMIPSTGIIGDSFGFREELVSSATMRRVLGLWESVYMIGSFGGGLKNSVNGVQNFEI